MRTCTLDQLFVRKWFSWLFFYSLYIDTEDGHFLDTGYLYDKTISGGRLGLYVFSQDSVIWKNMSYRCNGE